MANSYTTDQFYGIGSDVAGGALSPLADDNPPFAYPGNQEIDFGVGINPNGVPERYMVKRGFMRSLTENLGGQGLGVTQRRFFFQFNPNKILRSVSQRMDILNILYQTPTEAAMPVPGNSSFSFELLLDRQYEVFHGNRYRGESSVDDLSQIIQNSADDIGVVADLQVLDAVIGVGITQDSLQFIQRQAEIIKSYEAEDTTGASATVATTASETAFQTDSLNVNIGNSAFLIAKPVRVVFSSLFMVEGYVDNISVLFTKFNRAMVPVQATVTISMQALYIGFAKERTFLTYALENFIEKPTSEMPTAPVIVERDGFNALNDIAKKGLTSFVPYFHEAGTDGYTGGVSGYTVKQLIADGTVMAEAGWYDLKTKNLPESNPANDKLIAFKFNDGTLVNLTWSFTLTLTRKPIKLGASGQVGAPVYDETPFFSENETITLFSYASPTISITSLEDLRSRDKSVQNDSTGYNSYKADYNNPVVLRYANEKKIGTIGAGIKFTNDEVNYIKDNDKDVTDRFRDNVAQKLFTPENNSALTDVVLDNIPITATWKLSVSLTDSAGNTWAIGEATKKETLKRNDRINTTFNPHLIRPENAADLLTP